MSEMQSDKQTFGFAIMMLKKGRRVAREGWNGKGMWLCLAGGVVENPQSETSKIDVEGFLPWIGMKTVGDTFVPWLASQTDMLAEDWMLVN